MNKYLSTGNTTFPCLAVYPQPTIRFNLLHNKSPIELPMLSVAPIGMEIGEEQAYWNG